MKCAHVEQIVSRSSASDGLSLLAQPLRLVFPEGTPVFLQLLSHEKEGSVKLIFLQDHLTFRQVCSLGGRGLQHKRVCAWPLVSTASLCPGDNYDVSSTHLGLRPMQHIAVMDMYPIRLRFNVMGHAYSAPAPWQVVQDDWNPLMTYYYNPTTEVSQWQCPSFLNSTQSIGDIKVRRFLKFSWFSAWEF